MIFSNIRVICPLCERHQRLKTIPKVGLSLFVCDSDDGGCDANFAIDVTQRILYSVTAFSLVPASKPATQE